MSEMIRTGAVNSITFLFSAGASVLREEWRNIHDEALALARQSATPGGFTPGVAPNPPVMAKFVVKERGVAVGNTTIAPDVSLGNAPVADSAAFTGAATFAGAPFRLARRAFACGAGVMRALMLPRLIELYRDKIAENAEREKYFNFAPTGLPTIAEEYGSDPLLREAIHILQNDILNAPELLKYLGYTADKFELLTEIADVRLRRIESVGDTVALFSADKRTLTFDPRKGDVLARLIHEMGHALHFKATRRALDAETIRHVEPYLMELRDRLEYFSEQARPRVVSDAKIIAEFLRAEPTTAAPPHNVSEAAINLLWASAGLYYPDRLETVASRFDTDHFGIIHGARLFFGRIFLLPLERLIFGDTAEIRERFGHANPALYRATVRLGLVASLTTG